MRRKFVFYRLNVSSLTASSRQQETNSVTRIDAMLKYIMFLIPCRGTYKPVRLLMKGVTTNTSRGRELGSTPLKALRVDVVYMSVHHWKHWVLMLFICQYTTESTACWCCLYVSTPLKALRVDVVYMSVHHWKHWVLMLFICQYTTESTACWCCLYVSTPLKALRVDVVYMSVHHWKHCVLMLFICQYTTESTACWCCLYVSTPLKALRVDVVYMSVHHWKHCVLMLFICQYSTESTVCWCCLYVSTAVATKRNKNNVLFNDTIDKRLTATRMRRKPPAPPCGLLFPISSKASGI